MPTLPQFWSALEADFHKVLQEYTLERNRDEIRSQWLRSVRGALIDAWNSQKASVSSGDAWAIRALVKAEGQISRQLAELVKDIRSLEEAA
jgi:CRISPR system Cascade subunit CasA